MRHPERIPKKCEKHWNCSAIAVTKSATTPFHLVSTTLTGEQLLAEYWCARMDGRPSASVAAPVSLDSANQFGGLIRG